MKHKTVAVVATAMLSVISSASAAVITGKVIDSSTDEPMEFVNVTVSDKSSGKELPVGTMSDINGAFKLNNLPQGRYNVKLSYDVSFFMNIARLTSLPFLHACWCGIAGYFLSFAELYPKYRRGLYTLAICVPMLIHGLYDTFSDIWGISLVVVFLGLMLLMIYLKQGINYQSKLRQ